MKIYAASYLLPIAGPSIEGGALAVADGRIIAVGKLADLRARYSAPVREFPGCVLMPGFVNAHSHLELTHFPSWKIRKDIDYSPRTYVDWLIQVIKIVRGLSRQERELSLAEGIRISRESGTTAVGDILSDRTLLPLYGNSSFFGRIYLEAIGQDPLRCSTLLEKLAALLAREHSAELALGLSPHTVHTLSSSFMQEVADLAGTKSIPLMIHLAESREETAFMFDSTGKIAELLYPQVGWQDFIPAPRRTTPVAYLEELGVLRYAPTMIHGVHVTPAEAELLKKHGVTVVLCPRSNEKLAVGRAPAYLFRKLGIPLALGTDSLASNDSLSMQDEMSFLLGTFPEVFTPAEVLHMATLGGARAIGLEQATGSLEEGKRADFLVMELEKSAGTADISRSVIEQGRLNEIFIRGEVLKVAN